MRLETGEGETLRRKEAAESLLLNRSLTELDRDGEFVELPAIVGLVRPIEGTLGSFVGVIVDDLLSLFGGRSGFNGLMFPPLSFPDPLLADESVPLLLTVPYRLPPSKLPPSLFVGGGLGKPPRCLVKFPTPIPSPKGSGDPRKPMLAIFEGELE